MSISDAIAPHIPFLRRFARALCGTQAAGDAYVAATLEEILADPRLFRRRTRTQSRPVQVVFAQLAQRTPQRACRFCPFPRGKRSEPESCGHLA